MGPLLPGAGRACYDSGVEPRTVELESDGVSWAPVRRARALSRFGRALLAVSVTLGALTPVSLRVLGDSSLGGMWSLVLVLGSVVLTLVVPALFIASFAVWFRRGALPGRVKVGADGLSVVRGGAERIVPLSSVRSAFFVWRPHSPGPLVVGSGASVVEILLDDGDEITARAPSEEAARAMVDALGFGPRGARVHIPLGAPDRRWLHLALGIGAYWCASLLRAPFLFAAPLAGGRAMDALSVALTVAGAAIVAPAMLGLYALFCRLARAPEVTVGDDGIAYSAGRRSRFLARGDVAGLDMPHPAMALTIHLREGLGPPIVVKGAGVDASRRAAVARIAYERGAATGAARQPLFERGGRTVAAWRNHVRRLLEDGSYRSTGTSRRKTQRPSSAAPTPLPRNRSARRWPSVHGAPLRRGSGSRRARWPRSPFAWPSKPWRTPRKTGRATRPSSARCAASRADRRVDGTTRGPVRRGSPRPA